MGEIYVCSVLFKCPYIYLFWKYLLGKKNKKFWIWYHCFVFGEYLLVWGLFFYLFSRAFALCLLLGGGDLSAQFCENFNNGQVGNWQNVLCTRSINQGRLRATDLPGFSWLLNYSYNSTNMGCGTVCFDYDIIQAGVLGRTFSHSGWIWFPPYAGRTVL